MIEMIAVNATKATRREWIGLAVPWSWRDTHVSAFTNRRAF